MTTFLLILLGVYLAGIAFFMILVVIEARKQAVEIGLMHFAVALIWPFWGSWYLWILFTDWIRSKRNK